MKAHSVYLVTAATLAAAAAACGGDSTGPGARPGTPGVHAVAGANVTDTAFAMLTQALVVEVRDSTGHLVPAGTIVRFTGMPLAGSTLAEVSVEPLSASTFSTFAAAETDVSGRAQVLVRLGTKAGPARLMVSVPLTGAVDTARFTVKPANAARFTLLPSDTSILIGGSFALRGTSSDQYGNVRDDAVSFSASGSGISVTSAGVVNGTATGRYTVTATASGSTTTGKATVSVMPQGRAVTWTAFTTGLVLVNVDGTNRRQLAPVTDGGVGPRPSWMPDGAHIVYSSLVGGMQTLMVTDTNGATRPFFASPIPNVTHQADPMPTADGQWLYFGAFDSRCGGGVYCLYRSHIDGSNPELVGTSAAGSSNLRPAPSPDGSRVVVSGGFSYVLRVFDVATKTLSPWSVSGFYAAWSPDGTQIAYISTTGDMISFINPDGSGQRSFPSTTTGQLFAAYPIEWTRDGKYVLARDFNGTYDLVDVRDGTTIRLTAMSGLSAMTLR